MVTSYWNPNQAGEKIRLVRVASSSVKRGLAYSTLPENIRRYLDGAFVPYESSVLKYGVTEKQSTLSRLLDGKKETKQLAQVEYISATRIGGRSSNIEAVIAGDSKVCIQKVVFGDQELALNVKGSGYRVSKTTDFIDSGYRNRLDAFLKENGTANIICEAEDDFLRPWGGQSKTYAEQELRLSELKLLGIRFPPVFYIAKVEPAFLVPAATGQRSSESVMQEIRGIPSNVRLGRYSADTGVTVLSECAKDMGAIENKEKFFRNLFNSLFMISSMSTRSEPGSVYYLPFGNVGRDSCISLDGTMYFVDLEEIECENLDTNDAVKQMRIQLKNALPTGYKDALTLSGLGRESVLKIIKEEADAVDDALKKDFRGYLYCAAKRLLE